MQSNDKNPLGDHLSPLIGLLMGCICLIEAASRFSLDAERAGVSAAIFLGGAKLVETVVVRTQALIREQRSPILW
ncbi:MAG: hypothetical protein WAU28_04295 [Candidatus Moraniibacteriota bacterium]